MDQKLKPNNKSDKFAKKSTSEFIEKIIVTCSEPTRINKYIAQSGLRSRREADDLIEAKQIKLNGSVLNEQGIKVKNGDIIEILKEQNNITLILNKPVGYASDHFSSTIHAPAIELIKKQNAFITTSEQTDYTNTELNVLGRLDADSRGLLVFSNSGVLAKQLIGPESVIEKEYTVKVSGEITDKKIALLCHGMQLDGQSLKEAKVSLIGSNELRFILREGKNRQIRRMCEKVDLRVLDLLRVRIGKVHLMHLPEGKWRPIEPNESFV